MYTLYEWDSTPHVNPPPPLTNFSDVEIKAPFLGGSVSFRREAYPLWRQLADSSCPGMSCHHLDCTVIVDRQGTGSHFRTRQGVYSQI